jgi:16S rRNA (uracil1498-N3)-methyltransferase
MPDYDFRSPRLHVEAPLGPGVRVRLEPAPAHYLTHVLRLRAGDRVLAFNGHDGEWQAVLSMPGRKAAELELIAQTRPQTPAGHLTYAFAPLKAARLDYMVQKAVEMGASRIAPVLTRHTQVTRVNTARMRANAIEAAEQCGILAIPAIDEPVALAALLTALGPDRLLVFCDEAAEVADPLAALADCRRADGGAGLTVLVGPEGGFAPEERDALLALPRVVRLALGPRILRADTAAVAALAMVQAVLGDWRAPSAGAAA